MASHASDGEGNFFHQPSKNGNPLLTLSETGFNTGLIWLLGIDTRQKDKKRLWQVLAWLFVLCGPLAYGWGWTALLNGVTYWFPTEFWFSDAIAMGVFAVFFFLHAAKQNEKE